MKPAPQPFIVGWEEWVALPELGLPAIKAKIDTGARTSALHAFLIEPYGPGSARKVRFGIHPVPGRDDVEVFGSAEMVGRREVTSSNGEKESRIFIRTPLSMGERTWLVEIGLTNREGMAYRMLLGRQAIRPDMMVDARGSFHQPRLSYRLYGGASRRHSEPPRLRIALVGKPESTVTVRRLAAAAAAAGHEIVRIDPSAAELVLDPPSPALRVDGKPIEPVDAVIPHIGLGDGRHGPAVVRQLELMGAFALNSGDALDRRANPLAVRQALSAAGLTADLAAPGTKSATGSRQAARKVRVLVVGGRAIAAMPLTLARQKRSRTSSGLGVREHRAECRIAERAAATLQLGLVAIDVDPAAAPPRLRGLTVRPALSRWGPGAMAAAAEAVITHIESEVRPLTRRVSHRGEPVAVEAE